MAELALAIIPLGLKTCASLVSYLGGLKDHNSALARLKRLLESLEASFRLLDGFLNSDQLDLSTSKAATYAIRCLANCEDCLKDLKEFGDKLGASSPPKPTVKDKMKGTYRKLSYPLRQAQLTQLENALDSLCTPLNLAVKGLHLELQAVASSAMALNAASVQRTELEVSTLAATISHLTGPISTIQPQLAFVQSSIDSVALQIDLIIKSHFKAQMDEIRASFQQAESAASQLHVQTAELLSRLSIDDQKPAQAVYRLASRPSALYELASTASACSWRAVELTLRTTTGAGGFSISPSINYFAMVDEGSSPAFRVISLLVESRLGARWAMESYPGLLFESITRKLRSIFRSGRARPTDINSKGYSLLHHLTLTMHSGNFRILTQQQRAHPSLKSLFDFLIAAGTPVSAVGSDGRLALHIAADEFVLPSSILAQLCVDDAEIPAPRPPELRFGSFGRIDIATYDGVSQRIAEALFGPLTLAILRNNVREVEDLINRSPECMGEVSFYGETPCYVAIEKPEILRLLVKRATPEQLVQPCRIASGMISPLGRSIRRSKSICNSRGTTDGSVCPCTEAVRILLEAKYPIRPYYDFSKRNIFGMAQSLNLFISASTHCKLLIARQVKMCQQEFEESAPRTWLLSEIRHSSPTQSDIRSIRPEESLQRQANAKPTTLQRILPAQVGCKGGEKPIFRPIWLDITRPEDASIFRHTGFTDIDDAWTHPSLSKQAFSAFGPDVWQVLDCTSSQSERSSYILAEIIINNRKNLKGYLTKDPLAIEYTDSCTCQCSPEGYTPFAYAIRCLLESYSSDTDELRSFVEDFGGMLTTYQHTAVLRQAVFADLDMLHTCSTRSDFPDEALDDRVYTATDDGDKAAFIDSVIVEFKRFMLEDADATESEGKNDDMYLFRKTRKHHQRALEFWDHILPSMMGQFEQTLASTRNPDPEALKDLGVTLWIEEEKKQEVCARVYEVRRDDEESRRMAFEELMDKLEMIE
ncbi:uncharacterized protein FTJAE_7512 [Fusarium tjaetaba]|uniref:Fungal N-terminal domain-containing protein n=1 Tax=Fusarium tjaetaba TaxID=1567544 RepID=A0A8H5VPD0_9HYPO|nr:uncharacterized protein FTJAE_7512 [Fusarium tjaetaba]KAF5632402.1 hypothetical protein FTJAE_7512 [Fusarium tjaetaba]